MITEIKAPNKFDFKQYYIFLAGSIDMGSADHWQERFIKDITPHLSKDSHVIFLNPRRDDWDSTWRQDISDPKFREQVEWEITAMEKADMIVMYFDPNGKSPITLLELGLNVHNNIVVCCPDGYWRKGNVQIICNEYGIPLYNTYEEFINHFNPKRFFDDVDIIKVERPD